MYFRKVIALWESLVQPEQKKNKLLVRKVLLSALVIVEFFYIIVFRLSQAWRRRIAAKVIKDSFVISVGNIALGGTGKTLFCQFLAKNFDLPPAFICRGYGGEAIRSGKSLLVSNGFGPLISARACGDEAHMLARLTRSVVVVGASRSRSSLLLSKVSELPARRVIVLDDAYQNHELKKNCEILLLDARYPLENGYCFPAGKLREKDISRAHIIVLTHADKADSSEMNKRLKGIGLSSGQVVVRGQHKTKSVISGGGDSIDLNALKKMPLFVVAGIGSFEQFFQTVQVLGDRLVGQIRYYDHHSYTRDDYRNIISKASLVGACGIITTEKDWSKLQLFYDECGLFSKRIEWYVIQVEFEFLTSEEYSTFKEALRSRVALY